MIRTLFIAWWVAALYCASAATPVFVSEVHSATDGAGAAFNGSGLNMTITGPDPFVMASWHAEFDGGFPNDWTVTLGGVAGTLLVSTNGYTGGSGNKLWRTYYWTNPPTGTRLLLVTNNLNTSPNELAVSAVLLTNVWGTNSLGAQTLDVSTSNRTGESETVASATNDLMLHVIADRFVTQGTLGAGETSRSRANDGTHPADGDASLWISTKTAGSSSTTVSSTGWASGVISGLGLAVHGTPAATGPPWVTDGSYADVNAKMALASNGDAIIIPAGTNTWSSQLTVTKGVKFVGAGAGRVVGRSVTSVTIGTGTKTFTTTQSGISLISGQTLTIQRTGGIVVAGVATSEGSMTGTVTSYSGTTLVMNITSTVGSGTQSVWMLVTPATTVIVHSAGTGNVFSFTENTSNSIELSGIRFTTGTGTGNYIGMTRTTNGKPILIHDCYFSSTGDFHCIQSNANRGIIWNSSFVAIPYSSARLAIHQKDCPVSSWDTVSTMGTADTDGTHNLYVEDCDFDGWLNAFDFDDNSRGTVRKCIFNNAGFGTHGADTSAYGQRHFEVYFDTFIFNGFATGETLNVTWWFFLRGGTGVIASNTLPDIASTDYNDKCEINMTTMNLQRAGGGHGCWGANVAGNQYPAPRQVGFGYVDGSGGVDNFTYVGSPLVSHNGESEPLYIWGNTGTYTTCTSDYGGTDCTSPDSSANYIVAGRDFFNNGTAKPGWVAYQYPHNLRTDVTDTTPPTVVSAVVGTSGTSVTLNLSEAITIGSGGSTGLTGSLSGGAVTLSYSSGTTWSTSRTIYQGESGTLSYTQPGNGIEDTAGNDLVTFSGFTLTNSSTQTPPSTNAPFNLRLLKSVNATFP